MLRQIENNPQGIAYVQPGYGTVAYGTTVTYTAVPIDAEAPPPSYPQPPPNQPYAQPTDSTGYSQPPPGYAQGSQQPSYSQAPQPGYSQYSGYPPQPPTYEPKGN